MNAMDYLDSIQKPIYCIMNKDQELGRFTAELESYGYVYQYIGKPVHNFKVQSIDKFIESRMLYTKRADVSRVLESVGLRYKFDLVCLTHGVSMNDTLWIKEEKETIKWKTISPYTGSYPLRVEWLINNIVGVERIRPEYATSGNFPKCWFTNNNKVRLIKCGMSGAGNAGLEPFSEALVCQVAKQLGIQKYVTYDITAIDYSKYGLNSTLSMIVKKNVENANNDSIRYATVCNAFTSERFGMVSASELNLESYQDVFEFCRLHNLYTKALTEMFMCDCLSLNQDRHLGNIGFLFNNDTFEIVGIAPMYDNNISLLCYWDDSYEPVDSYIKQLSPRCMNSFDELADLCFKYDSELHKRIGQMRNFSFKQEGMYYLKESRLELLSDVVREQVKKYAESI